MFGRYQLFDRIGVGGMAEIYLARAITQVGGAGLAVVKQMLPELSENQLFSDMLVSEAKLASRLHHANIVQVFDLGRHDRTLYIAMEYVEGLDLNALLRRCAKQRVALPIEFSLFIVMEVLRALSYAHTSTDEQGESIGLVHRDVSPSNILISFDGEVKVCDFGIARANQLAEAGMRTTFAGSEDMIRGKAGYMSPEQALGEAVDERSDVFAAGIVLWELLAGRKLYRKPKAPGELSTLEQARRACIAPIESIAHGGHGCDAELARIVNRALVADRAGRFQSAQEMLLELDEYVKRAGMVASPIRLGAWLKSHFEEDLVVVRRSRERGAHALSFGPAVVLEDVTEVPFHDTSLPAAVTVESCARNAGQGCTALATTPSSGDQEAGMPRASSRAQWKEPRRKGLVSAVLVVLVVVAVVVGVLMR